MRISVYQETNIRKRNEWNILSVKYIYLVYIKDSHKSMKHPLTKGNSKKRLVVYLFGFREMYTKYRLQCQSVYRKNHKMKNK